VHAQKHTNIHTDTHTHTHIHIYRHTHIHMHTSIKMRGRQLFLLFIQNSPPARSIAGPALHHLPLNATSLALHFLPNNCRCTSSSQKGPLARDACVWRHNSDSTHHHGCCQAAASGCCDAAADLCCQAKGGTSTAMAHDGVAVQGACLLLARAAAQKGQV